MAVLGGVMILLWLTWMIVSGLVTGADTRDGADGSGAFGRRCSRPWTWW
jgi:hypothetical protein